MRFLRSGAAAMDPSDVKQLEKLFAVPFVDSYGMTETGGGVFSTLPGLTSPTESTGVAISSGLEVKVSLPTTLKMNINFELFNDIYIAIY